MIINCIKFLTGVGHKDSPNTVYLMLNEVYSYKIKYFEGKFKANHNYGYFVIIIVLQKINDQGKFYSPICRFLCEKLR